MMDSSLKRKASAPPSVNHPDKKKKVTVAELKDRLRVSGLPTSGLKHDLECRLHGEWEKTITNYATSQVVDWSQEDVLHLGARFIDMDVKHWNPADATKMLGVLDSKPIQREALWDPVISSFLEKCGVFRNKITPSCGGLRRTVTADEIFKNVSKLLKVVAEEWGDREIGLLKQTLGGVSVVNARGCSPSSVSAYLQLCDNLGKFYALRPDVKAELDPYLVIADISGGIPGGYAGALAGYPPIDGAAAGALPAADNPGPTAIVWSFPNVDSATHFIGYMQATLAGFRMLLVANAPAPPVIY